MNVTALGMTPYGPVLALPLHPASGPLAAPRPAVPPVGSVEESAGTRLDVTV